MSEPDDEVVSCPVHPDGPAPGCEPCRIIGNDILGCTAHPNGPVDGCSPCDAIVKVWADFFEAS